MSDEREQLGFRDWLGLYSDLFEVIAGIGAVASLLLWLLGVLPGPVALFIGGICIGAFLFLMIGQQFVSNNRPIESIGAHLPNVPRDPEEMPLKRTQADFERQEGHIKELGSVDIVSAAKQAR
jgi:hypothetical protein